MYVCVYIHTNAHTHVYVHTVCVCKYQYLYLSLSIYIYIWGARLRNMRRSGNLRAPRRHERVVGGLAPITPSKSFAVQLIKRIGNTIDSKNASNRAALLQEQPTLGSARSTWMSPWGLRARGLALGWIQPFSRNTGVPFRAGKWPKRAATAWIDSPGWRAKRCQKRILIIISSVRASTTGLDLNGVLRFVFVLVCLFSCPSLPKRKTKRDPKPS